MNSSFLYHAWGLYSHECTREEYKGNTIILHVQSKKCQKECPKCGSLHLVKNGYRTRDFLGLPIGGKKIIIRLKVQRYKCKDCDYDQQEKISFAKPIGLRMYPHVGQWAKMMSADAAGCQRMYFFPFWMYTPCAGFAMRRPQRS